MVDLKNLWLIGVLLCSFCSISLHAQSISSEDWTPSTVAEADLSRSNYGELPANFLSFDISVDDFYRKSGEIASEIEIPDPSGTFETYVMNYTPVVADHVAHLYTIKTYRGYKKDDPTILVAYDISDNGFHAAVYDGEKSFVIEPLEAFRSTTHLVYRNQDSAAEGFVCGTNDDFDLTKNNTEDSNKSFAPNAKKTFRVGFVTSGEYSSFFGGSPFSTTNVLNALASGVNLISPIFLRDLGIELNLVSNAACVYQNAGSDPFNLAAGGTTLAAEARTELNNALGVNGYDVGELIARANLGGIAYAGSSCNNTFKGQSYSGDLNTNGLWFQVVAHELGHQFGSLHNFSDNCQGNSSGGNRYEPGSGSSIMCYGNRCGGNNYVNGQLPFFHYRSISAIQNNNGGGSCGTTNAAGNSGDPIADAKANLTIPKQTPFILVGDASDPNDPFANLTFEWEQYNGNGAITNSTPDCSVNNTPLFRHRSPSTSLDRVFPAYANILNGNNNNVTWEKLPCIARNMNFSFAVRDNNTTFGRVDDDRTLVTVDNSGPFDVSTPNGGESLVGNASYTVTWTVNGTNSFCPLVDILFSSDNGSNYIIVEDAVPNTGSFTITVPNVPTTNARILVMCDIPGNFRSQSTFFDISDAKFTVTTGPACPNFITVTGAPIPSGTYSAEIKVDSSDPLQNSGIVDFEGGTCVELSPGFLAPASTVFTAINIGCL